MARFTDLFIQRPVLATVVSLLILIAGLRAIFNLPVQQFPKVEYAVITVTTTYPGAAADVIEPFVTAPLEQQVAGADGIDYMTSESTDGVSTITANIKLNFDSNIAFMNVMSKVQQARAQLPKGVNDPVIQKQTGSQVALMYISFSSDQMSPQQIADYISRVVQPKLETVSGVAQAQVMGSGQFAMRIWLDTQRMAGLGVTATDVNQALLNNNFQASAGTTRGKYVQISINPKTDIQDVEGFKNIVIKTGSSGALVRLKDIARVELGANNYDTSIYFNGKKAVFVAIIPTPAANPLSLIADIKKILPAVSQAFPPTLEMKVVYDATVFIHAAIYEVIKTIIEAAIIVIGVIFLFLGSLRTVTIPIVTIPLSLVGVCMLMLWMGYSINLLTLLAMVLAIGMVVDDAIVVVENIYRHIEEGMQPYEAALQGAREIAMPIVTMTITLAAVYTPIGLMGGLTGALFKEFVFTLAFAVIISGFIALTLSPMMCSKIFSASLMNEKFVHYIDEKFEQLKQFYQNLLSKVLGMRPLVLLFAFVVLLSCAFLYMTSSQELAPQEDDGVIFAFAQGPQYASLNFMEKFMNQTGNFFMQVPGLEDYFIINGTSTVNNAFAGLILKPWNERDVTSQKVYAKLQTQVSTVTGLQVQAFLDPPLPTTGNPLPIQFVITGVQPYSVIYSSMQNLVQAAQKSGLFMFIMGSLHFDKPQVELHIDRNKAAQLGVGIQDLGQSLTTFLSGGEVNLFSMQGQSYQVIPQIMQQYQLNPQSLNQIYVRTSASQSGSNSGLIPLSAIAYLKYSTAPDSLSRFQQLNAATLQGMMMPGHSIAEGLNYLQTTAKSIFPQGMSFDYAGQSRQYIQEGNVLMFAFMFSIIIIFLVLAAQFESFRDPLVIMLSVPMAICGALLPINWGIASINIYTQIGLITLIGLITKHGILMVDFANQLRRKENLTLQEAIERAAAIRLRPILMTTFAMILGVVPLLFASGAGAASRFNMGLVIACGMAIGTLFTLFIVPTMYSLKTKQILMFLLSVAVVGAALYFMFFVVL